MLAVHTSCAIGYYKDPGRSAATFREIEGTTYAMPGDQARLDADGTLTLLGRGSNCINSGGEKIWPEEVEEVLKEHPGVSDAVVMGVPDDEWGQIVAAVVATTGADAARCRCARRLGRRAARGLQAAAALRVRRRGGTHHRRQARLRLGARRAARRLTRAHQARCSRTSAAARVGVLLHEEVGAVTR